MKCLLALAVVQPFRYLNISIKYPRNLLCTLQADEFQVLESLIVAVVSDFWNHICCSSLYLFYFNDVSS